MSEVLGLVDRILVPHSAFQGGLKRMFQCYAYAKAGAIEPVCIALIGESRTGKSRCVEAFMQELPSIRLDDGIQVPVMSLVVPSRPTVKSLAELGLRSLGALDWHRGTENAKTSRLATLMRECRVMVLVLDEFHHFYDKGSHRVQHHVADWLKNLVGETKVVLLVSGLPTLQAVIDQNEQLAGRFASPILMPRFDWFDENHRSEWFAILSAFTEGLGSAFDLPAMDSDDMALRIYCATGGLMGYLTKTLRQAVWNAAGDGCKVITLRDLEVAHQQAVWSTERLSAVQSPFDRSRLVYPSADLIAQTKLIGTAVPVVPVKHRKVKTASGTLLASSVLAT
jgi:hypothetical protein